MLSATQQKKLKDLKYELIEVEKEFKRLNSLRSHLITGIRNLESMASHTGLGNLKVKKSDSHNDGVFRTTSGELRFDKGNDEPVNYRQDFTDKAKELRNITDSEFDENEHVDMDSLSPREKYAEDLKNLAN